MHTCVVNGAFIRAQAEGGKAEERGGGHCPKTWGRRRKKVNLTRGDPPLNFQEGNVSEGGIWGQRVREFPANLEIRQRFCQTNCRHGNHRESMGQTVHFTLYSLCILYNKCTLCSGFRGFVYNCEFLHNRNVIMIKFF